MIYDQTNVVVFSWLQFPSDIQYSSSWASVVKGFRRFQFTSSTDNTSVSSVSVLFGVLTIRLY